MIYRKLFLIFCFVILANFLIITDVSAHEGEVHDEALIQAAVQTKDQPSDGIDRNQAIKLGIMGGGLIVIAAVIIKDKRKPKN